MAENKQIRLIYIAASQVRDSTVRESTVKSLFLVNLKRDYQGKELDVLKMF